MEALGIPSSQTRLWGGVCLGPELSYYYKAVKLSQRIPQSRETRLWAGPVGAVGSEGLGLFWARIKLQSSETRLWAEPVGTVGPEEGWAGGGLELNFYKAVKLDCGQGRVLDGLGRQALESK